MSIFVGDVVIPREMDCPFKSDNAAYSHAICISIDPFILASDDATVTFRDINMIDVMPLCQVRSNIIKRCLELLTKAQ